LFALSTAPVEIHTQTYLDSLMRVESINASNNLATWDLNIKLGMTNFVLKDEWVWMRMLDSRKIDTDHNFIVYLVGQNQSDQLPMNVGSVVSRMA
jgi:hypothetical protein